MGATATLYYFCELISKQTDLDEDMGSQKAPKTAAALMDGLKKIMPNKEKTPGMIYKALTHGQYEKVSAYMKDMYTNIQQYAGRVKEMLQLASGIHASDLAGSIDKWLKGRKNELFDPNDKDMQEIFNKVRTHLIVTDDYSYKHPETSCDVFGDIDHMVALMKRSESTLDVPEKEEADATNNQVNK